MTTIEKNNALGIRGDERNRYGFQKWSFFRTEVVDYQQELLYQSRGPWPTPAPGRPLSEYAEVANLPKEELDDWSKNLKWFYIKCVISQFIPGLWWAFFKSGRRYVNYTDDEFNNHITQGMYSKFFCPLDPGDSDLFKAKVPTVTDDPNQYVKMDFSCIDWICTKALPDTHIAATIVLFKVEPGAGPIPGYRAVAIYIYQTDEQHNIIAEQADTLTPEDGNRWGLGKYFAIQGAVHRINMTEHGQLHFPFDTINAVTKSIFPTKHPLCRLLIPHLRLSLSVNNSVLEGAYSLLSRVNWVVYSPFASEGKYARTLIRDGYVGRENKLNAFPPYEFSTQPKYPNTSFGIYLRKNYQVIYAFVKGVIEETLPNIYSSQDKSGLRRNWELIALWAESISGWVPNFPIREQLLPDPDNRGDVHPERDILINLIAYIIWDLTVAHAADHIGFGNAGPTRNVFRIHVKPPLQDVAVADGFEKDLVKPWDLFQSYLSHQLFYKQHNTSNLQEVVYDFSGLTNEIQLQQLRDRFIKNLQALDQEEHQRDPTLPRLKDVAASIQY